MLLLRQIINFGWRPKWHIHCIEKYHHIITIVNINPCRAITGYFARIGKYQPPNPNLARGETSFAVLRPLKSYSLKALPMFLVWLIPNTCRWFDDSIQHYSDVIMSAMASQITGVYSTVCSDADIRNHQSSGSLAFVMGIHRWPVNISIWWRHHEIVDELCSPFQY